MRSLPLQEIDSKENDKPVDNTIMDISGISFTSVQSAASQAQPNDAVSIKMLKKAMDIQESQAQQLIASVAQSVPTPQSSAQSLPQGQLGQNIDIKA